MTAWRLVWALISTSPRRLDDCCSQRQWPGAWQQHPENVNFPVNASSARGIWGGGELCGLWFQQAHKDWMTVVHSFIWFQQAHKDWMTVVHSFNGPEHAQPGSKTQRTLPSQRIVGPYDLGGGGLCGLWFQQAHKHWMTVVHSFIGPEHAQAA